MKSLNEFTSSTRGIPGSAVPEDVAEVVRKQGLHQYKVASDLAKQLEAEENFSCSSCGAPAPLLTYMYQHGMAVGANRPLCNQCRERHERVIRLVQEAIKRGERSGYLQANLVDNGRTV